MNIPTKRQFERLKLSYPEALLLFNVDNDYHCVYDDVDVVANHLYLPNGTDIITIQDDFIYDFVDCMVRLGHKVAICNKLKGQRK